MTTRFLLIRHAKADADRTLPEAEWPLSDEGRRQAEELAAGLASRDIDVVWSSPFVRALATVEPFARAHGYEVRIENDLRERHFSPVWIEDFEPPLKRSFEDAHFALPGGETGHECRTRFMSALSRIADLHRGETIAVATHGNAIALTLSALDPSIDFDFWKSIRNPDIFELSYDTAFRWRRPRGR